MRTGGRPAILLRSQRGGHAKREGSSIHIRKLLKIVSGLKSCPTELGH
jgi:hypothetical protein